MQNRDERERELKEAIAALWPRLRRFAMTLTGSPVEADELVQATCQRALSRLHHLEVDTRLDAWMYQIMRTVWVDDLRSRRVRRHEPIESAHEIAGEDGNAVVESRLTLEAVRRALAELPEELRTVLVLVCVDGFRYREAAEILEIPIGTVMSRMARGRLALAEKLSPADRGTLVPLIRAK